MFIITELTIATDNCNDLSSPISAGDNYIVDILGTFTEELQAQDFFLNRVEELRALDVGGVAYEALLVSKTRAHIHKKKSGWLAYYKSVYKIIQLHHQEDPVETYD